MRAGAARRSPLFRGRHEPHMLSAVPSASGPAGARLRVACGRACAHAARGVRFGRRVQFGQFGRLGVPDRWRPRADGVQHDQLRDEFHDGQHRRHRGPRHGHDLQRILADERNRRAPGVYAADRFGCRQHHRPRRPGRRHQHRAQREHEALRCDRVGKRGRGSLLLPSGSRQMVVEHELAGTARGAHDLYAFGDVSDVYLESCRARMSVLGHGRTYSAVATLSGTP